MDGPRHLVLPADQGIDLALGRPLGGPDIPVVKAIHALALENGGNYPETMVAITLSDLVRMKQPENALPGAK